MRIFVSYAKEDRPHIESIAARLRQLGHEPWYDQELRSGPWWDQILAGIRGCDLFVATVSPAALSSRACLLERRYAADLQRTQLLLMIVPVAHHLLPGDLAPLQIVDYTARDEAAAFRLFGELNTLRPSPALPVPLPVPPRPPLSHLTRLRDRITGLPMGAREQLEVVDELAQTVRSRDPEEVGAARELLLLFGRRTDNFEATADRIRGVLGQLGPGPQPAWGPPPAGQYPSTQYPSTQYPAAQHAPPAPQRSSRRIVTVLAWIGGVVVVLIVLAVLTSGSRSTLTPQPVSEPCFDLSTGQQVDPIFCQ